MQLFFLFLKLGFLQCSLWFPDYCWWSFFLPTSPAEAWNEAGSDCRGNRSVSPASLQLSQARLQLPNSSNLHVSLGLLVPAESQYVLLETYDAILDLHHWRIYITLRTFPISFQDQMYTSENSVGLRSGPIGQTSP